MSKIEEKYDENGAKIVGSADGKGLPGNGGHTEKYIWQQTLDELQIFIPTAAQLKCKDLKIDIGSKHLYVGLKGQEPIIDDEFFE